MNIDALGMVRAHERVISCVREVAQATKDERCIPSHGVQGVECPVKCKTMDSQRETSADDEKRGTSWLCAPLGRIGTHSPQKNRLGRAGSRESTRTAERTTPARTHENRHRQRPMYEGGEGMQT